MTEILVMNMGSSCACCGIRGDLVKTLFGILLRYSHARQWPCQRVFCETTSGLAYWAPTIQKLRTDLLITRRYPAAKEPA